MDQLQNQQPTWRRVTHGFAVISGAVVLALSCFLVLPILKAITTEAKGDLELRSADIAVPPPPPPPVEQEEPEPEPDQPPPPQLDAPPLTLDQMNLVLGDGLGGGVGSFGPNLDKLLAGMTAGSDTLFDLGGLEQKPRPVYQKQPDITPRMKKNMPCTVYVLCTITEAGRVENPVIQSSDHPSFERAALDAIRKWKFEPGRRGGKPVSFRIRQKMSFK